MTADAPWLRASLTDDSPCPCGGAAARFAVARGSLSDGGGAPAAPRYGDCCAPLHRRERHAESAVELMCARYSAYVAHEADYLWMTWHPRRRPDIVTFDPGVEWTGLEVVDVVDGAGDAREGIVEFRAHYRDADGAAELWERSTFMLRGKRWMYVDGEFR